ncbi:Replication protein A 70 kDa DNA-binding subunit B [Artemisia annua]|uniref:Replication protein A 70 kDa DNA-binding subunit B n=1 Tax=Artemisia annua TaxID=35608 RepID=A0A2U1LGU7_ARTAN|nr:Replication protein A 70 kDa DNA-binding subunit B [Artemisia annua]
MSLTVNPVSTPINTEGPVILPRQFAYLTELSPADNIKYIQVRVYRKWTGVKVPGFTPTNFSCILLDKKGSAVQANADLKEKDRFDRDLQINNVYKIQGFGFERTDSWGKTLDNDFTLTFGKYTQIDQLTDTDYPYHYFNFAAFNELNARLEKKNPILTGQIQLSATSATRYYFNPDVQETSELLAAYNKANASGPHLQVQTERLTSWDQEKTRNRVPLGTLLQIDPKTQQRVLFTQEATVLQIDTGHHWYYQKCDECGGKLTYGYLHGQCHQYGTKPNPENRMVITDGTGNALMSCFTPQTDGLIKDVNALLNEVENKDPAITPPAILALQNTRHVFQFQFATPTTKGPPTFILKKIMDNPPMALPAASAGPSSPPVLQSITETDEHYTPPPVTPTVTQDTPADAPATTSYPPELGAKKQLFPPSTSEEHDRSPKKQKNE